MRVYSGGSWILPILTNLGVGDGNMFGGFSRLEELQKLGGETMNG